MLLIPLNKKKKLDHWFLGWSKFLGNYRKYFRMFSAFYLRRHFFRNFLWKQHSKLLTKFWKNVKYDIEKCLFFIENWNSNQRIKLQLYQFRKKLDQEYVRVRVGYVGVYFYFRRPLDPQRFFHRLRFIFVLAEKTRVNAPWHESYVRDYDYEECRRKHTPYSLWNISDNPKEWGSNVSTFWY